MAIFYIIVVRICDCILKAFLYYFPIFLLSLFCNSAFGCIRSIKFFFSCLATMLLRKFCSFMLSYSLTRGRSFVEKLFPIVS